MITPYRGRRWSVLPAGRGGVRCERNAARGQVFTRHPNAEPSPVNRVLSVRLRRYAADLDAGRRSTADTVRLLALIAALEGGADA